MIENRKYLKEITNEHYETLKEIRDNIRNGKYPCSYIDCSYCPFEEHNDVNSVSCYRSGNMKGRDWSNITYNEKIELIQYMLSRTDYAISTNIMPPIDVNTIKEPKYNRIQWLENYVKQRLKPIKFVVGEDNYSIMWDLSNHSFKVMKANYSKHFLQVHFDNKKGQVEQACRDLNDKNIKPQQIIYVFKKLNYFKEEM